jgi:hypothetical protein
MKQNGSSAMLATMTNFSRSDLWSARLLAGRRAFSPAALAALALSLSCAPPPLEIEEGCSPLLSNVDCGLPYPSDFFLADDPSLPSGKRVLMPERAKLITSAGDPGDVHEVWTPDGFSRLQPIVLAFGVGLDPASVHGILEDPAATIAPGFKTAILEADTGRRVAHFGDVDPRALEESREALVLHAIEPFKERTRYVVAVSGLLKKDKTPLDPPEAFRRLRDAAVGDDPILAPLLTRYEEQIFPVLERDGLPRSSLQLAWDFTTGSDERVVTDMLSARALAIAELEHTDPVVEVDGVFEGRDLERILGSRGADAWRMVKGYVTGPRVVDSDRAGARLARDDDGAVRLDGFTRFPFTAIIPNSVRDRTEPGGVLLFGHGFFGDRDELEDGPASAIAHHAGLVTLSIDWQGMSVDDVGKVVETVGGRVAESILFGERVAQAMVNWNTVTRALKLGLFAREPAFRRPSLPASPREPPLDGYAAIDPAAPIRFLGISQGHLLGGTLTALNPDIERSILMVGGGALGTMMFRARPFTRFLFLLDISMPDPLDQRKLGAMMQSQFDRFDPAIYGQYAIRQDLPLGPTNNHQRRRVLEMVGLGDTQVPNIGSDIHARVMGIPQLIPSAGQRLHGLEQRPYPVEGSGYVLYDFGIDTSFYAVSSPAEDGNVAHEAVRRVPQALDQMDVFLNRGKIINPCGGPCVVDVSGMNIPH